MKHDWLHLGIIAVGCVTAIAAVGSGVDWRPGAVLLGTVLSAGAVLIMVLVGRRLI